VTTILIVDDEHALLHTLTAILAAEGYATVTAADGQAALAEIERARPDLAVLDLMMPVKSGLEVLAALRADSATAALPVVVMSGMRRPRDVAEDAHTTFLQKPFRVDTLLRTVRALLRA
jgi:DNA-binding response OmpR family regulator